MADNGEEKLLAVARHIAKTLGHNDSITDDILHIFSTFDGRFSRENLSRNNMPITRGVDIEDQNVNRSSVTGLEQTLRSLDRQILHYVKADYSIWSDSANSGSFLDAIDELILTMRDWDPMAGEKIVGACLVRADDLLQQAMFRLEAEFRSLMERDGDSFGLNRSESTGNYSFDSEEEEDDNGGMIGDSEDDRIPIAHPITDYNIVIDAFPSGTINAMNEIAKRMVTAGFGKECSHVYASCRRDFLEESISRLVIYPLNIEEVQKTPWPELEEQIERWIKPANITLRVLFTSERRLCDRVFSSPTIADMSFLEVCRGSTIQLLDFADAIATGSRSPERLFKVLDVYETMRDLLPEFEALFSDQCCVILGNEAIKIWKRLGDAIRGIFMELENSIRRDPAKTSVPGGGMHPITRYVMNYLRAACRSKETLEQVFEEGSDGRRMEDRSSSSSSSSLSVQVAWIMELLETNLDAKSKIFREPALRFLFMMNNGRYIVEKVKDSELGSVLGDDWIRKQAFKVRQYLANYQRNSWQQVIAVLKLDNNNVASKQLKEKLKLFNSYFDETWGLQSTWVVYDELLKDELRISVAEIVAPAYRNFLGRFKNASDVGRHGDTYIKYSPESIEARINKLFSCGLAGARK